MHARYWLVALIRAIVAFAAGFVIALDQAHTAAFGLVVFGVFAVLSGLVIIVGALIQPDRSTRTVQFVQAAIGIVAGVIALVTSHDGLGILLYLVSVWALLTGAAELYLGVRSRRSARDSARDWTAVGGFTIVLAIVFLLIPADPVLSVGLFGAYAAMIGVYIAIGAFSLKWAGARRADEASAEEATETHAS